MRSTAGWYPPPLLRTPGRRGQRRPARVTPGGPAGDGPRREIQLIQPRISPGFAGNPALGCGYGPRDAPTSRPHRTAPGRGAAERRGPATPAGLRPARGTRQPGGAAPGDGGRPRSRGPRRHRRRRRGTDPVSRGPPGSIPDGPGLRPVARCSRRRRRRRRRRPRRPRPFRIPPRPGPPPGRRHPDRRHPDRRHPDRRHPAGPPRPSSSSPGMAPRRPGWWPG